MSKRRGALAALAFALVAALVGAAGVAGAQNDSEAVFRALDTTIPQAAIGTFLWTGDESAAVNVGVAVNGTAVPPDAVEKVDPMSLGDLNGTLAVVIDSGPGMNDSGALQEAKNALEELVVPLADDGVRIGIWVAGDQPFNVQPFTANREILTAAIEGVGPSPSSALWGTIEQAGKALDFVEGRQTNLLVIAGTPDEVTAGSRGAARGAVITSLAVSFVSEYTGEGVDTGGLADLVEQTGGIIRATDQASGVRSTIESLVTAMNSQQYQVHFDSGVEPGQVLEVQLDLGGTVVTGSTVAGGNTVGYAQLDQDAVDGGGGLPILNTTVGFYLGVLLVLLAVAAAAYAITLLFTHDDRLTSVLQPYAEGFVSDDEVLGDEESMVAKSALIQRAVELTEQVADSQGYLARMEVALERANLPLRAGEALFFYLVFVGVLLVLGFLLSRNAIGGLVIGVIAALIPAAILSYMANSRRKKFMGQLPDTLQLLAGTLRAGYSLMQGVEAVSQEVEDPMGVELRRVVTESRLGRPLEESLDGMADRMDSPDFAWAVMAIRIQREVGGNLAELLMTVAETMTARERLRREVNALTAEGRVSAYVLAGLPFGLGFAMFVLNPGYIGTLFSEPLGWIMIGLAALGMVVGFLWMRKIINIEI